MFFVGLMQTKKSSVYSSGLLGLYLPRLPELLHGQRWEEAGGLRSSRESPGTDTAHARHQPHQHHGGSSTPQPGDHQHPCKQPPQRLHSNRNSRDHSFPGPQSPTRAHLWGQPGAADWLRGWDSQKTYNRQHSADWMWRLINASVRQPVPPTFHRGGDLRQLWVCPVL